MGTVVTASHDKVYVYARAPPAMFVLISIHRWAVLINVLYWKKSYHSFFMCAVCLFRHWLLIIMDSSVVRSKFKIYVRISSFCLFFVYSVSGPFIGVSNRGRVGVLYSKQMLTYDGD